MELEPNLLDWNVNELERELELEDMKRTNVIQRQGLIFQSSYNTYNCSM